MGYDKYGLDWSVWGSSPKKAEMKNCAPVSKKNQNNGKKEKQPETDNETVTTPEKKPISCTLKSPRFIPDASTDFTKPCKITVEVEGELSDAVHFALWARYKGTEYNLNHEQIAQVQNGTAQAELKLFYVDEHYDDLFQKGEKDATVEYFLKVTADGCKPVTSETFTMPCTGVAITVTPKVKAEFPLILLDRKLSTFQDPSETSISSPPVYIELFLEQSSTAQTFPNGVIVTVSGSGAFDCFEDLECKKPFDLSTPLPNDKISGGNKLKLWFTGTKTGICKLEVKLQDPITPFIAGDAAVIDLAVIELKLNVCKQDTDSIQKIQIDPDQDPVANYYTELKNHKIPEQIEMSDQDKVATGRVIHAQKEHHFSRAKLILKKIGGNQFPAGIDDLEVIISETAASGSVECHTKEWDDELVTFPIKFKLKDVKSSDQIVWIQGKSTTKKANGIILDCGLSKGGNSKEIKRFADWVKISIVEIKEVKVDYTPVAGQAVAWDSANSYFFINTKADPDGREVTIGAQLSEPVKDIIIHFMMAPHKDNQKAANWGVDLPTTWKWKDISPDLKHTDKSNRKDLVHLWAKTDATGYAKMPLVVSRFGGDKFYLCAYIDQDPHLAKFIDGEAELQKKKPVMAAQLLTVRRKFWYQMTYAKGSNPQKPQTAVAAYDRVRTDMVLDQTVEFEEATAPARTFYPEYVIKGGASNAKVTNIGDYNKNSIATTFFRSNADQPSKNHLIYCDNQYDSRDGGNLQYTDGRSDPITSVLAAGTTIKISMRNAVFNPALHGVDMIVDLYWFKTSNPGNVNNIPKANANIKSPRVDNREIEVVLPALAGSVIDPIYVYAECFSPVGPYLGESFGKHSLIVYNSADIVDYNDTVTHEIGHAFNQTPGPNKQPDPTHIPSHPNQADRGQGNHCQESDPAGQPICAMYDSGPLINATALHRFCDICHPYLIAEDFYKP